MVKFLLSCFLVLVRSYWTSLNFKDRLWPCTWSRSQRWYKRWTSGVPDASLIIALEQHKHGVSTYFAYCDVWPLLVDWCEPCIWNLPVCSNAEITKLQFLDFRNLRHSGIVPAVGKALKRVNISINALETHIHEVNSVPEGLTACLRTRQAGQNLPHSSSSTWSTIRQSSVGTIWLMQSNSEQSYSCIAEKGPALLLYTSIETVLAVFFAPFRLVALP